jgi:hypothetical protein
MLLFNITTTDNAKRVNEKRKIFSGRENYWMVSSSPER